MPKAECCTAFSANAALLTSAVFILSFAAAAGQDVPCIARQVTQTYLDELLNPRASGDLTVLVNLPHSRVYCSPLVARFILIGIGSESHKLALNESRPYSGGPAHPDVARHANWKAIDVTKFSSTAEYDLLLDESHGLTKDAEHFVAISGCTSTSCRTAGFVKFTAWRRAAHPEDPQQLFIILVGCGAAAGFLIILFIVVLVIRRYCRTGQKPPGTNPRNSAIYNDSTYARADRLEGHQNQAYSYVDSGVGGLNFRPSNIFDDPVQLEADLHTQVQLSTFLTVPASAHDEGTYVEIHVENAPPEEGEHENTYDEIRIEQSIGPSSRLVPLPASERNSAYDELVVADVADAADAADVNREMAGTDEGWRSGAANHAYRTGMEEIIGSKNDFDRQRTSFVNQAFMIQDEPVAISCIEKMGSGSSK